MAPEPMGTWAAGTRGVISRPPWRSPSWAVIVSASNPLRSYADTKAYEAAFKRLDLLVCVEIAVWSVNIAAPSPAAPAGCGTSSTPTRMSAITPWREVCTRSAEDTEGLGPAISQLRNWNEGLIL